MKGSDEMVKVKINTIVSDDELINSLKNDYYSGELSSASFDNKMVDFRYDYSYRHYHAKDINDTRLEKYGDDRKRYNLSYPG